MRGVIKPILYFVGLIVFAWLVAAVATALSSLGGSNTSSASVISSSTSVSSSVSSNQ